MASGLQELKDYMLSKSDAWWDVDGQIIYPEYSVTISSSFRVYLLEVDIEHDIIYCLCARFSLMTIHIETLPNANTIIDTIVNEFNTNKNAYVYPYSMLDGQPLPEPIGLIKNVDGTVSISRNK